MAALARVDEGGNQPQVVDTLGGRMDARWDEGAAATPHGRISASIQCWPARS